MSAPLSRAATATTGRSIAIVAEFASAMASSVAPGERRRAPSACHATIAAKSHDRGRTVPGSVRRPLGPRRAAAPRIVTAAIIKDGTAPRMGINRTTAAKATSAHA